MRLRFDSQYTSANTTRIVDSSSDPDGPTGCSVQTTCRAGDGRFQSFGAGLLGPEMERQIPGEHGHQCRARHRRSGSGAAADGLFVEVQPEMGAHVVNSEEKQPPPYFPAEDQDFITVPLMERILNLEQRNWTQKPLQTIDETDCFEMEPRNPDTGWRRMSIRLLMMVQLGRFQFAHQQLMSLTWHRCERAQKPTHGPNKTGEKTVVYHEQVLARPMIPVCRGDKHLAQCVALDLRTCRHMMLVPKGNGAMAWWRGRDCPGRFPMTSRVEHYTLQ